VTDRRPTFPFRPAALAVALVAMGVAAGLGARAQDAGLGLRRDDGRGPLSIPAAATRGGSEPSEAAPARPGQRSATRRQRRAAAAQVRVQVRAQVRAPVRVPTIASGVAREVQAPVAVMAEPAEPLAIRRRRAPPDDPYASLGLRLGGLTVFPAIEQSVGHDSNPNRVERARKGSLVSRTEGELRLQSDWSVHEFSGSLRGAYSAYPDVKGADRPEGAGKINLRLDASRDTRFDLEGRFELDTLRPGSPDLRETGIVDRPLIARSGASLGVTHRMNHLLLGLKGSIDRTVYDDARLSDGSLLDQSDRDRTQYELSLRAGYELTPGLIPFVEAGIDTRDYDRTVDFTGYARSSDGVSLKAGTTFELSRILTGEVSAGYQQRRYDDPRLRDMRGPIADAALIWQATPLTTVRLRGTSQLGETTLEGSSGAIIRTATLEVQHDLRRNLSVIGALSLTDADYKGVRLREQGYAASAKMEYKLTRSVALKASFTHERLKSTAEGSDYTANVFLVGLRFQP
jgi:hypothetical protein